jgi:hypothetical protein
VVPASRDPEKLSGSKELKPSPSREVAPTAWLKKICVYGLFPLIIDGAQCAGVSIKRWTKREKSATLIEKPVGGTPAGECRKYSAPKA